jgi:hypothetical protein
MVLILSNKFDLSTSDVINWLDYQGTKWFRITNKDKSVLVQKSASGNSLSDKWCPYPYYI